MDFGSVIHFLAGPVIGGCIGYFTNFIAIHMLFRPRNEVKIGNFVVPFTPGIIPKRKDKLARAIGETVAENVFTQADIEEIFLSDGMKEAVADSVMDALGEPDNMYTILELMDGVMTEEESEELVENVDQMMYLKVHRAINHTDIAGLVTVECRKLLREKVQGSMAGKVLTTARISSIADNLGSHMQQYTKENVESVVMPMLRDETAQLLSQPLDEVLAEAKMSSAQLRDLIGRVYAKFIREHSLKIVKLFDIAGLTERKIIEFEVAEIEELVNHTIKKEMQMVINLGAVLGVIIGFVNTFI